MPIHSSPLLILQTRTSRPSHVDIVTLPFVEEITVIQESKGANFSCAQNSDNIQKVVRLFYQ